jgi:hypothetical protein
MSFPKVRNIHEGMILFSHYPGKHFGMKIMLELFFVPGQYSAMALPEKTRVIFFGSGELIGRTCARVVAYYSDRIDPECRGPL